MELGSERRETVRPLSAASVGYLREVDHSKKCCLEGESFEVTLAKIGEILYDKTVGPFGLEDHTKGRSLKSV